jgi:threonine dehydratase
MHASIQAGRIVEAESLPTLADGTSGGIEPGSITFDLCRRWVDEFILLSEEEILAAIRLLAEEEGLVVEGAAALSVAALLKGGQRFAGRRVALIISGSRIDEEVLRKIGRGP